MDSGPAGGLHGSSRVDHRHGCTAHPTGYRHSVMTIEELGATAGRKWKSRPITCFTVQGDLRPMIG
jgi:hypothetical protein